MFNEKELKLINRALTAWGCEDDTLYAKIDKLINKPVETTNEQPLECPNCKRNTECDFCGYSEPLNKG